MQAAENLENRRRFTRLESENAVRIETLTGDVLNHATIADWSAGGVKLLMVEACDMPERFVIVKTGQDDNPITTPCTLRWQNADALGATFF